LKAFKNYLFGIERIFLKFHSLKNHKIKKNDKRQKHEKQIKIQTNFEQKTLVSFHSLVVFKFPNELNVEKVSVRH
jgi:hypothetical protein